MRAGKIDAGLRAQILDDDAVLDRPHVDGLKIVEVEVLEGERHLLLGQDDDLRNGNGAVGDRHGDGLHDLVDAGRFDDAFERALNGSHQLAHLARRSASVLPARATLRRCRACARSA